MSDQPDVLTALKAADALIDNLWEAVPWGQTFDLDIAALNTVPPMIKATIAEAEQASVIADPAAAYPISDEMVERAATAMADEVNLSLPGFDERTRNKYLRQARAGLTAAANSSNIKNTLIVMLNALQVAQYAIEQWHENDNSASTMIIAPTLTINEEGLLQAKKALDQAVDLAQKELKL